MGNASKEADSVRAWSGSAEIKQEGSNGMESWEQEKAQNQRLCYSMKIREMEIGHQEIKHGVETFK